MKTLMKGNIVLVLLMFQTRYLLKCKDSPTKGNVFLEFKVTKIIEFTFKGL